MMDSDGIWLTTSTSQAGASCKTRFALSDGVVAKIPEIIDGEATIAYLTSKSFAGALLHNGWCYNFGFITYSPQTLTRHRNDIDAILKSFRFNR